MNGIKPDISFFPKHSISAFTLFSDLWKPIERNAKEVTFGSQIKKQPIEFAAEYKPNYEIAPPPMYGVDLMKEAPPRYVSFFSGIIGLWL